MNITVKLFATLGAHLPPADRKARATRVEVPEGTSLLGLIERMALPRDLCTLVLHNGVFVPQEILGDRCLEAEDTVAIWPPVGGG
ncbi:MoaD/ThiS family protein [Mesoterricola sediminis]|uniref:Molybdopterin synthase sulfur carrier subunit n=1 Tax=Mesoterricola sediminis TaxID=2927980 RepID=A0AA48GPE4_9BACT|nr:MoaD/ThiS family protein [Mesoterricola sediminis]BDU75147.1 hypothetical protein METESE_01050 [Mesoterricola sediminis]